MTKGSVLDPHEDMDDRFLVEWRVDDPVGATACREVAGQLSSERLGHPAWVLAERSATELGHREGDRKRQLVLGGTPGGSRKP
jgi:hypothetical protein